MFDENALDGKADLATVGKTPPYSAARRDFEIGVGENDHRVFAAEFEHRRDKPRGAGFGDAPARFDAPGETDFIGIGIDQGAADFCAALNDRDEILRESRVGEQLFDERAALRSEVARLTNDGVACHHRGNDLAQRDSERIVPRTDDANHA